MAIAQNQLGTGATTVYTSTNNSAMTAIYFMNNHSSAVTVQIYIVPSGDSAAADTQIVKDLSIDAGDTYVFDTEKIILANGDTLQAAASTGSVVTVTVSYIGV